MNKKRGLHIVNGTVSPEILPKNNIYIGNKSSDNNSAQSGRFLKRKKFGDGGCGCGSIKNPKQQIRKRK